MKKPACIEYEKDNTGIKNKEREEERKEREEKAKELPLRAALQS